MGLFDGLGGLIGSIIGEGDASGDQEAAKKALLDALAQYQNVNVPSLGTVLSASQAGPSAATSMDLSGRAAALDAINYMKNLAASGGYTMADRVAQEQAMDRAAQYEQGQRGAIAQEMASRGQVGGGAGLAAKLAAAQGGAANAYGAGTNAAASAQMRALQAMKEAGGMGGQLYGQDVVRAHVNDAMSQFNAAQRGNAYQSNFANQMAKAGGIEGAQDTLAQYYTGNANRIRKRDQGWGTAIGSGAGAAANVLVPGAGGIF